MRRRPPTFDEILQRLQELEAEINGENDASLRGIRG